MTRCLLFFLAYTTLRLPAPPPRGKGSENNPSDVPLRDSFRALQSDKKKLELQLRESLKLRIFLLQSEDATGQHSESKEGDHEVPDSENPISKAWTFT